MAFVPSPSSCIVVSKDFDVAAAVPRVIMMMAAVAELLSCVHAGLEKRLEVRCRCRHLQRNLKLYDTTMRTPRDTFETDEI